MKNPLIVHIFATDGSVVSARAFTSLERALTYGYTSVTSNTKGYKFVIRNRNNPNNLGHRLVGTQDYYTRHYGNRNPGDISSKIVNELVRRYNSDDKWVSILRGTTEETLMSMARQDSLPWWKRLFRLF